MKTISSALLIIAAFALPMTSAQAAPATCPDPTVVGEGIITVDTNPSSACVAIGKAGVDLSPLTLLDKTSDGNDLFEGALMMIESSTGQGTFSVGATGSYTDLHLVVKDGNLGGDLEFQWGAFSLGALSGTWTIQGFDKQTGGLKYKGLSGGELWGRLDTTVIPVPAAIWLFGTALLGFAGVARRTRV